MTKGTKVRPSSHVAALLGLLSDTTLTVEEVIKGQVVTVGKGLGKHKEQTSDRIKASGKWFDAEDLIILDP